MKKIARWLRAASRQSFRKKLTRLALSEKYDAYHSLANECKISSPENRAPEIYPSLPRENISRKDVVIILDLIFKSAEITESHDLYVLVDVELLERTIVFRKLNYSQIFSISQSNVESDERTKWFIRRSEMHDAIMWLRRNYRDKIYHALVSISLWWYWEIIYFFFNDFGLPDYKYG